MEAELALAGARLPALWASVEVLQLLGGGGVALMGVLAVNPEVHRTVKLFEANRANPPAMRQSCVGPTNDSQEQS